jgi:hypothetical protein
MLIAVELCLSKTSRRKKCLGNARTKRKNYLTVYHNLKLTRDAEGVLVVQFH